MPVIERRLRKRKLLLLLLRVLRRRFELLRTVDLPTLGLLSEQVRPRRFRRGETIVRAGDVGVSMFFVNAGLVAAIVSGREVRAGGEGGGGYTGIRRCVAAGWWCGLGWWESGAEVYRSSSSGGANSSAKSPSSHRRVLDRHTRGQPARPLVAALTGHTQREALGTGQPPSARPRWSAVNMDCGPGRQVSKELDDALQVGETSAIVFPTIRSASAF